jgi:hypothetical protein
VSMGPQHYVEAERLLAKAAGDVPPPVYTMLIAAAQVHTLLALAAAEIDGVTGARLEAWQHAFNGNRTQL